MTKAVPVLFALLLLGALPAMAVVAAPPEERPSSQQSTTTDTLHVPDETSFSAADPLLALDVPRDGNTTSRLALDGRTTSGYVERAPDLGTTLATQGDELRYAYDEFETEHDWSELSIDERAALLDRKDDAYEEKIAELWARERASAGDHTAGEISDGELLRELVRIDREARTLADNYRTLESRADEVPGYTLDIRGKLALLDVHEGQVRDRMFQAMRGADQGDRSSAFLLTSAESGVGLSTVDGNLYLREATAFDDRDETAPSRFDTRGEVIDRADELYPWLDFSADRSSNLYTYWDDQLFRLVVTHEQGELQTYLDGGTGTVFYETQELFVDQLPKEPVEETWETDGLELSLVETPVNGPMEVTATDARTDEPVDAAVVIETGGDEYHVADTGSDGSVWLLPPPGQYGLTLETDGRSVSAQRSG